MNRKIIASLSSFTLIMSFAALSVAVFADENADKPTDEQIENIQSNCNSIKDSLKRVQKIDSKTRVTLGTTYQSILKKYITPLNNRFVNNNNLNQDLMNLQIDIANDYENFRSSFIDYSKQMEELIAIDCKENPNEFYSKLAKTRASRKNLNDYALKVNSNITKHIDLVTKLKDSMEDNND